MFSKNNHRPCVAAAAVLAAGLAFSGMASDPGTTMNATLVLVAADGAAVETRSVSLAAGATLVVQLRFHGGTGYGWVLHQAPESATLQKVAEATAPAEPQAPGLAGGPMETRLEWRGLAPGKTVLVCELRRPWEKDQPPARKLILTVTVTAAEAASGP